jgi:hypothetical protein
MDGLLFREVFPLRARRKLIKAYDTETKERNASRNSFKLNGK